MSDYSKIIEGAYKQKLIHQVIQTLVYLLENLAKLAAYGIGLSPLPIKLFISHTKRDDKALKHNAIKGADPEISPRIYPSFNESKLSNKRASACSNIGAGYSKVA